jgi:hypothetical protein
MRSVSSEPSTSRCTSASCGARRGAAGVGVAGAGAAVRAKGGAALGLGTSGGAIARAAGAAAAAGAGVEGTAAARGVTGREEEDEPALACDTTSCEPALRLRGASETAVAGGSEESGTGRGG